MIGVPRSIDEAARALSARLGFPVVRVEHEVAVEGLGGAVDGVVELAGGVRFAVEVRRSQRSLALNEAARGVVQAAARLGAHPVVVAPYISPSVASGIWDAGANFVDLSGNARILIPASGRARRVDPSSRLVADERAAPRIWIDVSGHPNAFPEAGRPRTVFGTAGARIARLLLLDPTRWWRQSDLSAESRVTNGAVSKIVSRLKELDALQSGADRAFRLSRPAAFLDAWADEYSWGRYDIVDAHLPGRGGADATRHLGTTLSGLGREAWAMTGLSAAWLLDEYATFRTATAFITVSPDEVMDALGAERVERGANLKLLLAPDAGVFDGAARVGEIWCVAPVQAYVDLLQMPERAADAARELRARHLGAIDAR